MNVLPSDVRPLAEDEAAGQRDHAASVPEGRPIEILPGELDASRSNRSGLLIKRALDLLLSAAALAATLPVQVACGVAVFLDDGEPVFYHQRRAGVGGRPFEVLKFRTMRVTTTPPSDMGQVGTDHPLVTRTGRVLRRFKFDELPQLLSVLRGDMSLVGPRPTLPEQAGRYDDFERRRLSMRPGITGWAQVNGNTALTWPDRILLDVWYVDHWSLWLDTLILIKTVGVVVRGERADHRALAQAREHADRTRRSG